MWRPAPRACYSWEMVDVVTATDLGRYRRNITLLYAIRGLVAALVIVPVIVPFWQSHGLTQTQIFLLQSGFGLTLIAFEVPSGYVADHLGRRTSLIAGAVLLPAGFAVYSFATTFSTMLVAEMVLGVGASFVSGADSALAYDSLLALGERGGYRRFEAVTFTWSGSAEAVASICGGLLAVVSLRLPVVVQVGIYALLLPVTLMLTEPPRQRTTSARHVIRDVLRVTRYALHGHAEVKWLIYYAALVGTLTHTMVWLIQPFYALVGVPLGWFGVLWAAQMVAAAVFARYADRYERALGRRRALTTLLVVGVVAYALLGLFPVAWLLPVLLGFYFVRGVQTPILNDHVNALVDSDIRATVLSVKSLAQKCLYVVLGPLIGLVVDAHSLPAGLLFSGAMYGVLGVLVLLGMRRARVL